MSDYQNPAIVSWAKQNLQNGFNANKFDIWRLGIIFFAFIFGLLWLFKILDFLTSKNSRDVSSFFNLSEIATFVLPIAALIYMAYERRRTVIHLNADGVKVRDGRCYNWSSLRSADYSTASINRRQRLNRIVLNFENGKAVVPAYIFPELLNILKTIPVQKKFNGSNSPKALERLYLEHGIE